MSSATSPAPRAALRSPRLPLVFRIGLGAALAIIVGLLGWFGLPWLNAEHEQAPVIAAAERDEPPMELTLPAEKLAAAQLQFAKIQQRSLAIEHTVPGKLEYNRSHQLEMKSPVSGVVKEVLVEPGQALQPGDRLAVLTSEEVGLARDEVLSHAAELQLANQELKFSEEIAVNLGELLTFLNDRPALTAVEQRFADKLLGDYRDKILSAYSKLRLAEAADGNTAALSEQNVISGRLAEERRSAREVASAAFLSACEQAKFASQQQRSRAAASVAHYQRLEKISRQALAALLGPFAQSMTEDEEMLSEFTLRSPLAGSVQERFVAAAERVALGEPLFTIADTSKLMIAAEIHERDWRLLSVATGQPLQVQTPALPDQKFTAVVKRVGSTVQAETRSVPLLAEIDNSQGLFKPGMFVWVTIPQDQGSQVTVAPAAAVLHQDKQTFVFTRHSDRHFHRVDVKIGRETPEWIEITSDLKPGDEVVTRGAFFLKSELLLEREAE